MDDKTVDYHYNIVTPPRALYLSESALRSDTTICNGNIRIKHLDSG